MSDMETSTIEMPEDPCKDTPCVTFLGNIRLGDNFIKIGNNFELGRRSKREFFRDIKKILLPSAAVIANLEVPLIDEPSEKKRAQNHLFWANKKGLSVALRKSNITAVSLANPHIMDFDIAGLKETTSTLKAAGIDYFGVTLENEDSKETKTDPLPTAKKAINTNTNIVKAELTTPPNLYRKKFSDLGMNFEIAILSGVQLPRNAPETGARHLAVLNTQKLATQIQTLKKDEPNLFIVAYLTNARPFGTAIASQQQNARALIDAGADLIIGNGSRFIQVPEQYKNRWIIYSLGETVTTTSGTIAEEHRRWPYSGMFRIILSEQQGTLKPTYRIYPILNNVHTTNYHPRLLNKQEFGGLFWYLLRKGTIQHDGLLKRKMYPGEDNSGRFIQLTGN